MIVGVPKEVKDRENRVSTTPAGVAEFVAHGPPRCSSNKRRVPAADLPMTSTWRPARSLSTPTPGSSPRADMIVKVKEPIAPSTTCFREGQLLFTYLHLAADEPQTRALMRQQGSGGRLRDGAARKWTAAAADADERSRRADGGAGRRALPRAHATADAGCCSAACRVFRARMSSIVGGGVVGTNAAQMALGMGANVTILDRNVERLRFLDQVLHGRIHTLASNSAEYRRRWSRRRSCHRRRADRRRQGAEAGHREDDQLDATRLGGGRCRDRSGWLHRDRPTDLAQRSDLSWSMA